MGNTTYIFTEKQEINSQNIPKIHYLQLWNTADSQYLKYWYLKIPDDTKEYSFDIFPIFLYI